MSLTYTIAADWGTSHLRLYLVEYNAQTQRCRFIEQCTGRGVTDIVHSPTASFETELFALSQPWLVRYPIDKIILSGAIGSSVGWHTVPYSDCPKPLSAIASHLFWFRAQGMDIAIMHGLKCTNFLGESDTLRGEELQLLGWFTERQYNHKLANNDQARSIVCLPGTHNKWVDVQGNQVKHFITAYTGELFALLRQHSVLIEKLNTRATSYWEAFDQGVKLNEQAPKASLLHLLFTTRTRQLTGKLEPEAALDFLSGLVIGHDICHSLALWEQSFEDAGAPESVTFIASPELTERYVRAMGLVSKLPVKTFHSEDAIKVGLGAVHTYL